jgi:hypothetical protein
LTLLVSIQPICVTGEIDLVMRQEPRAGERLFVDYAGQTVEVVD